MEITLYFNTSKELHKMAKEILSQGGGEGGNGQSQDFLMDLDKLTIKMIMVNIN